MRMTLDGESMGPGNWPNAKTIPEGKEEHPVSSISFFEAQAFVNWCNRVGPNSLTWSLPPEDYWEFAARTEAGFISPWGDAFEASEPATKPCSAVHKISARGPACACGRGTWPSISIRAPPIPASIDRA